MPAVSKFKIKGKIDVRKALKVSDEIQSKALKQTAELILGDSLQQVPLEESMLAQSGATTVDGDTAYIHYDTPYAVVQHENTSFRHDRGRKAKYLEDPLFDNSRTFAKVVANIMRKEF